MRNYLLLVPLAVFAMTILASCGSDDKVVAQSGPYAGAWAYVESNADAGSRIYVRVDALAANESGYEIYASGQLIVLHSEYNGGDFPNMFESEGTWSEEDDGDLVFFYEYNGTIRMLRVEILYIDEQELECVETRLNW